MRKGRTATVADPRTRVVPRVMQVTLLRTGVHWAALALALSAAAGCKSGGGGEERPPTAFALTDGGPAVAAPPEPKEPRPLLDRFVQTDLDAEVAFSPTLGSYLGLHSADDRLDDLRSDTVAREVLRARALLDRVRALPAGALDAPRQLERQLLLRRLEATLFELSELRTPERNPIFYVDLLDGALDTLMADPHLGPADRLRLVTARLWKFRPLLDEARRNLRGGPGLGTPELAVRRAIELAGGLRSFIGDAVPRTLTSGDPKQLDELRRAVDDAGRALDDFSGWLSRDLLPRAKGDLALGPLRFGEKLRTSEGVQLPPEELAAAFERALKESRRRQDEVSRELTSGKTGVDPWKLLEDDHAAFGELLTQAQAAADGILGFARAQKLLPLVAGGEVRGPKEQPPSSDRGAELAQPGRGAGAVEPSQGSTVMMAEMPPHLWGFVRLETARALEPRPHTAVLWVDSADPSWPERRRNEHLRALNRAQLVLRLLHELGGHLVVAERARRAPTLLSRASLTPSFVEGFAHYAEHAFLDAGYAPGDLRVRLAVERAAVMRAARALGAVRFHALGLRFEDLVKLLTDEVGLDEAQARREAERIAIDPLVVDDCLGRLAIEKLRADWRAAHPDKTMGDFHEALTAAGALPLPLLRARLLDSPGPLL